MAIAVFNSFCIVTCSCKFCKLYMTGAIFSVCVQSLDNFQVEHGNCDSVDWLLYIHFLL